MKTYASLHNHSDYSNVRGLDSINRVAELIDTAAKKGMYAIAITDHDVLSGHVKAIQHYKANHLENNSLKLILGNEIYITKEGLSRENYEKGNHFFHFLVLAKNKIGHEQIRKISSIAWERSFFRGTFRTPTYISDIEEVVKEYGQNLIATTACLSGIPAVYFAAYGIDAAPHIDIELQKLEKIFGKGNFFIEIQPSFLPNYIEFNKFMLKNFWGKYPFVFTTDSHYLSAEDVPIHEQFLKSQSANRDVKAYYSNNYLMTFEEISKAMNYATAEQLEEMRLNTIKIADMTEFYDLEEEVHIPEIPVKITSELQNAIDFAAKNSKDKHEYIYKFSQSESDKNRFYLGKIMLGYFDKISKEYETEYFDRIEYELEQIWEISEKIHQDLSSYFITMEKMINLIWNEGDSLVGVSRGSAAGFLTNYLLGITQLDPLRQVLELPAWRFIHQDRPGLPDIDIDTEGSRRTNVFNVVKSYFESIGGSLINVSTFGTEKAKSALRTAGRGLNMDDDSISYIVSMIPNERGIDWTLKECMYGNPKEGRTPVSRFQAEMNKYPKLWQLASRIEGLITRIGVHAAGVIALNDDVYKYNSVMKTSSGALVTALNLEDTEYMGGLKYDFLTINALDKIRTTLNLLLEDGAIEWHGSLRETYDYYLLPKNLDYETKEMWDLVAEGSIIDLFQFDTPVGSQAVRRIKPQTIAELSVANSVMRLMTDDGELPLDTYVRYKNDPRAWYDEMKREGLDSDEIALMRRHLEPLSGVADSQESAMLLVMDPTIAGFSITEANDLRRAIARKDPVVLAKTEKMFFEKGIKVGARQRLLDYVWNHQIMRQAGYSFSVLHTMGYSTIALQEMNLAYKYPRIYWNTACLSVNADAVNEEDYEALIADEIIEIDEDEETKGSSKVQYGKIAASISKFREELNVKIALPDINKAKFGFTPDPFRNEIVFGLKAISRIGDKLITTIIENRPYASLQDFLAKLNGHGKTVISRDRVVMLIKAGAFDELEGKPRREILKDFIRTIADQKSAVNLRNMIMLISYNLIPEELENEERLFNFTRYLRQNRYEEFYILDDVAQSYYFENGYPEDKLVVKVIRNQNTVLISSSYWDSIYNSGMNPVRDWMKREQQAILTALNDELLSTEMEKYASGQELEWELESLGFYHSGHRLEGVAETFPSDIAIDKITDIPDMERDGEFNIKGKVIPKYNIRHIIGTVIDKDKQKKLITLSTPYGTVFVKLFQSQFSFYDKVIHTFDELGEKVIVQDSFLKKGTFLFISGIKNGDTFLPKVYKSHGIDAVLMFTIDENGNFIKAYEKMKE